MHQYSLYLWTCQVEAELTSTRGFLLGPHLRNGATTKCLLTEKHWGCVNYVWCRAARKVSGTPALSHSPLQYWSRRVLPMLCLLISVFFSSILTCPKALMASSPSSHAPYSCLPLSLLCSMLQQVYQSHDVAQQSEGSTLRTSHVF